MLNLIQGDITTFKGDAIVNAANQQLLRGGGVCGAIFRKASLGLDLYCKNLPSIDETDKTIKCYTGDSIITPSFDLTNVKNIIHSVGPIYKDGKSGESVELAMAYYTAIKRLKENGLTSIAFPFISSGIYGYPLKECANIGMAVLTEMKDEVDITMYAFSDIDYEVLKDAVDHPDISLGKEYLDYLSRIFLDFSKK